MNENSKKLLTKSVKMRNGKKVIYWCYLSDFVEFVQMRTNDKPTVFHFKKGKEKL